MLLLHMTLQGAAFRPLQASKFLFKAAASKIGIFRGPFAMM